MCKSHLAERMEWHSLAFKNTNGRMGPLESRHLERHRRTNAAAFNIWAAGIQAARCMQRLDHAYELNTTTYALAPEQ